MKEKMLRLALATSVVAMFFGVPTVQAGSLSGETEMGGGKKSSFFASQYLFYDEAQWNLLARYFYVDKVLNRGEFALGPTFQTHGVMTKFQFGATTDREAMMAMTLIATLGGHNVLYIGDAKVNTTDIPNTFYEKLFVAITCDDRFQLRVEHLLVGTDQDFLRLGGEFRYQLYGGNVHFYVAPFYNPINKEEGVQSGLRFFNW